MSPKARFLVVYALCAAAVFVAAFILVERPFFVPGPPSLRGWVDDVATIAAMTIIAAVFGVGAARRPVASLAGAVVATVLTPVTCILPSPFEAIWAGWCLGTLARWILLSVRFVHHLIARAAKPSLDGEAGPIPSPSPRD